MYIYKVVCEIIQQKGKISQLHNTIQNDGRHFELVKARLLFVVVDDCECSFHGLHDLLLNKRRTA